jgi:UDP-N-acetylglucosamine 2-epimerase (non-hydrolysing)
MQKKKIVIVLGIRPDVIRASILLRMMRKSSEFDTVFIWSGQHYSDNLKDIFFRELDVGPPEIELGATGSSDAEISASIIEKLFPVLQSIKPEAAIFLGDTNTVMGSIAAAQNNIPIVHIEGCMRSYDWEMPEEKYRTVIDHLSDVIYCYFEEYKKQGIAEGLNPTSLVVTQNLIVDVLYHYYFNNINKYEKIATDKFFSDRGVVRGQYYLMTCHRRENVTNKSKLQAIFRFIDDAKFPVLFLAGYRTQNQIQEFGICLPSNVVMMDTVGYDEMLTLLTNSRGVITDSGTLVEEAAILQIPSVQMRKSTERPQTYDCRSSVKFDPSSPEKYQNSLVFEKLESLVGTKWIHGLGDGLASERILKDICSRLNSTDGFRLHTPKLSHLDSSRSYIGDGL